MKEQLISFETAKLANEKGFKFDWQINFDIFDDSLFINSPTQSLLQKWLREEKKIHISVERSKSGSMCYRWKLKNDGAEKLKVTAHPYECLYELALEQALITSLKFIK